MWEYNKLKTFLGDSRVRVLNKDECLCRENLYANYICLLIEGSIRVEKKVFVESMNYWPQKNEEWVQKNIPSHILFKVSEIEAYKMFSERICI